MTQQGTGCSMPSADFDAIVVGAGFGGMYMTHKLRDDLGMKVQSYDKGGDIGGTWYANRYPGILSDTESFFYSYSFDKELLQEWTWKNRYVNQREILEYLSHFADRYDIRKSYQFDTKVTSAIFNEDTNRWHITTDRGDNVTAQHFITGLGLLSATNVPNFKGRETFQGQQFHTANWPHEGVDFSGKRVGVIGTGSTGTQFITEAAKTAGHLTVFQRSPQYTVPIGNGPISEEFSNDIKANYDASWKQIKNSNVAFGFVESTVPAAGLPVEETDKVFEAAWQKGGVFRFMFETFCDIAVDPGANEAACAFIRKKIDEIVDDPAVAEKLKPYDLYAKRPLCDSGYYATFNRDNVTLADVKAHPIVEITPKGVLTEDGEYELDILVYATGFDSVDGNYVKMDIRGRDGLQIKDKWKKAPTSYIGVANAGFPNMHMILGPNGPFTNLPPSIETQVEWIADLIRSMRDKGQITAEPKLSAEQNWTKTCQEISDATLFSKADSWIFGTNIPGKESAVQFYLAGLGNYRKVLNEEANKGYQNYMFQYADELSNQG
ncbi:MAG: cyclohexanone monooxygenase [Cycloclasticus sp.]|nr:cyclohexanone monooxygenase [Cycloclasticus sp.]MBG95622.1 cyclohexanone monooxygenase [Cycloclasticus sp.]HAI96836.1 NAD(P)/FAD-dependent oxidoreductase [Methylococcaceae bacterium]